MKILYTEQEINKAVQRTAALINQHISQTDSPVVFIGVLDGAYKFFTELTSLISGKPIIIDFVKVKSYTGTKQHKLDFLMPSQVDITDALVFIVDDIIDTGNTMQYLVDMLKASKPANVHTVSLLYKRKSKLVPTYYCFEIPNESWVYGYGMDLDGLFRNINYICEL